MQIADWWVARSGTVRAAFVVAVVSGTAGAGPLSAQQTLALVNGDRLTGRLQSIDGPTWVFRYAGADAKIPVAAIVGFNAPQPIGVRLADGTIAAVTVEPADSALLLLRDANGDSRVVAPSALEAVGAADDLDELEPASVGLFSPLTAFWRASGSLGFSDKSGNSRARGLAMSLEVARRGPRDRLRLQAGLNRENARNSDGVFEPTVAKAFAALRADVFFTDRFFTFAESRQERDTFQDIALRSAYNGGLGLQLRSTATSDLNVTVSGGVRRERYVANGTDVAAVFRPAATLRQRLGPMTLDWEVLIDSNVENVADYRARSQASLTTTLYRGLGFRIAVLNELNNTPRPGVEKHDMLVSTTIAYSIGQ